MKYTATALAMTMASAVGAQPSSVDSPKPLVEIHAVVSDARGQSVGDLGLQDFELLEDGEARPIDRVRLIDATSGGTRIIALLLDEYHVSRGSAERVRASLARFVSERIGPDDLVVVFKPLDSLLDIKLTSNRELIAEAIATFEGRKGEYAPRNAFERDFIAADPRRLETMRTQISMAALNGLVTRLSGLESSRKALVLVSEGFGPADLRRGDPMPSSQAIVRAALRAGVSIYPLDPGEDSKANAEAQGALRELADATHGAAAFGAGQFDAGLERAITDVSRYYLVAFQSAASADGEFHQVQLRVTRRGTFVSAPRGHWAPSTEELYGASLVSDSSGQVPPPLSYRRTSLLIRPWFGITQGPDGASRVSFVWEPAARVPGTPSRVSSPARVMLRVSTSDGVSLYEGIVVPVASRSGGDARATFHAPAGTLLVEMSIEDASAKRLDTDVRNVAVSALAGPVSLGTAQVFRASTARQFRELAADADAVPVAARDFGRSERLLVRIPVYAQQGAAEVTAKLSGLLGRTMRTLVVETGPTPDLRQIDLPLAGLVTGEYRVEVTAGHDDQVATESVGFRVVP